MPPKELSVYDDAASASRPTASMPSDLRKYLTEQSDKQIAGAAAQGRGRAGRVSPRRRRGPAGDDSRLAAQADQTRKFAKGDMEKHDGYIVAPLLSDAARGRTSASRPLACCRPDFDGTVVVWIHPHGQGEPV